VAPLPGGECCTQLGARHRRRTPTIHRGSAQRTIAIRPTGRLQVTRQRSGTGRPSGAEDGRVSRPCPNQRIVASEAEEGDNAPRLTLHASRLTPHASRLTPHASRSTPIREYPSTATL